MPDVRPSSNGGGFVPIGPDAFGQRCPAQAVKPEEPPEPEEEACGQLTFAGLSPCQRLLKTRDCWVQIGHAYRQGYTIDPADLKALMGSMIQQHVQQSGTDAVWEAIAEIVSKGGPTASLPMAVAGGWTTLSGLVGGELDDLLDLMAARQILAYASELAVSWARHTGQNMSVSSSASLGAGI